MKTLYLVRHAKASPGNPALPDRERPLDERGLREAATMGQRLAQRGVRPDAVLSSPAARALATAQQLAQAMGIAHEDIVPDERLYNAAPDALLGVLQALGQGPGRVMLVGHNPGLTELANYFVREITNMPTCAVAELAFDVPTWADIEMANPAQTVFDEPAKG
ncbi:MAG: histidine phosphatase family protein [Burkholderiaceae bacterium]|nr:histidine phosphatase family protein [Burkholderiaceae bacterium]